MTSIPNYMDAVNSLAGGKHKICSTHGEYPTVWKEGATDLPTEEEIQTELASMISAWEAQEYFRNRQPLYPDIGDQLDDLYHAGVFSADMTAKLKKVKDDNPK